MKYTLKTLLYYTNDLFHCRAILVTDPIHFSFPQLTPMLRSIHAHHHFVCSLHTFAAAFIS